MNAGVIGDPYYRFNEREYQWVAQETWMYETHVTLPSDVNSKPTLVFETLDGWEAAGDHGELLRAVQNRRGTCAPTGDQADEYPYFVPATENFNTWTEPTRRSFVRKAGSDFGWDWGPAFVTSGMAGAAYIEFEEAVVKLKDLQVVQVFPRGKEDASVVDVTVRVALDSGKAAHENVTFNLFINDKKESAITTTISKDWKEDAAIDLLARLENPKLWWPAGYGEPYLYDIRVDAWNSDFNSSLSHKTGIRQVELIQDDTTAGDVAGKTFYFKINRVPIFIKGANWIPTDSFSTRTKASTVRHLLGSVRAANMNMVRVWGGGRYESDLFYAECDRLGILVWQELMFACGMYPRDSAFLQNVLKEVGFQISRLRKYTSIAIWGGNNENENMMEQFVEAPIFPPGTPFNRDIAVVDFTKLFVDLIHPTIVAMDSSRPFVDTSPSNGLYSVDPYVKRWGPSNGVAFGDVHFYDYNSDCQDYRMYPRARFVSEFGFQSWPSAASLHDVSSKEDWGSFQAFWKILKFRQRHENGTTQMLTQLQRRFHVPFPFRNEKWLDEESVVQDMSFGFSISKRIEAYLYLTQIQQSLCYQTAIQTWRRGKSIELDNEAVQVYAVSDVNEDLQVDIVFELRRTKCGSLVKTFGLKAIAIAALVGNSMGNAESRSVEELDIDALLDHDATSCHRRSCFLGVRCVTNSSVTGIDAAACEDTQHFFAPFKHLNLGWGDVVAQSVQKTKVENTVIFSVDLVATNFTALFVEVEVPGVLGYWSSNSFLMVGSETKTLNFTVALSDNVDKLSIDAFSSLLRVNWLQKSYDNSIEDVAVQ
ncbi:beta-mannosidase, putative [Phytophthora infestans T30-4]|uniref:beta-mannosidase n=1 Tax=Phytophthora infestans (strain T30-4) TaxID=403677 RepID=D0MTC3_PHYIT|nr:beta-mannosidase, putative [Phytophthora infestans T30-4]EEY61220.1 beta-mannosidase, putative [Phytophthora infestans T30-4]|eukprot:XP_002908137.1 beta-mannosidase, putative [Phytophthora infestans T30-4]